MMFESQTKNLDLFDCTSFPLCLSLCQMSLGAEKMVAFLDGGGHVWLLLYMLSSLEMVQFLGLNV